MPLLDEINDASKKLAKIEQTPVTYVGENPVIVSSVYKIILKNVDKIDAATDMIYSLGGGIWDNGKVATVRNDSVAALRKVLFKISLSVEQPSIEDGGLMDKIVVLEKQLAASSYENERADKDAIIIKQNKNIALLDRAVKKRQNRMIIFYAGKVLETEDRPEERAKMQRAIVNASVLISRGIGNNYFVDEKPFSSNPKPAVKIHRIKTHLPGRHGSYEKDIEEIYGRAAQIDNILLLYLKEVASLKKYPPLAFRSCRGILSLEKKYGIGRLVAACACATQSRRYGYNDILDILEKGDDADFMPSADTSPSNEASRTLPQHKNIRGRDYYTKPATSNKKSNRNGNKH